MRAHRVAWFVPAFILAVSGLSAEEPKTTLPSKFDLRTVNGVTPIKSQAGGTCWAHGTMAAVESHLLVSGYWRASGKTGLPSMSEYHLDWWNGFNKHDNPDCEDVTKDTGGLKVHQGGDYKVAAAYMSRGLGCTVLPTGHDPFQDKTWHGKAPSMNDPTYQRLYVRDVEWFTIGDDLSGIDVIKRRIMTDGGLGTCYSSGKAFISKDNLHYQPISTKNDPNHAVCIVGWDDGKVTTDADVKEKAPAPGAWLIKNSWGPKRGDAGYYWISYYDKHCARHPEMGAVSFRNVEPMVYTDIYGHDLHGWRDVLENVSKAANAFVATGKQTVRAVSFYTMKHGVNYTATVYGAFDGKEFSKPLATVSGTAGFCGFHTVNLPVPFQVEKGNKFYVRVDLSAGGHAIDRTSQIPVLLADPPDIAPPPRPAGAAQPPGRGGARGPWVTSKAGPGESFYHDGTGWKDLYEYKFAESKYDRTANVCIKALAVTVEQPAAEKIVPPQP